MNTQDLTTMLVGATAWTVAIPAVKIAGNAVAPDDNNKDSSSSSSSLVVAKSVALVVGVAIAAITTPLLSYLLNWQTPHQRVRGIALALGTAQVIDGLVHMFVPDFYSQDKNVSIGCAANIFYGAGLLGLFSAYA